MIPNLQKKLTGGRRATGEVKRSLSGLPLISIVTTIRDSKHGIDKAIDEVQRQTYANKEHIVIDGGSDDGTVDVLKKRESEIDYWISEADAGIYDAMNKGIDVAAGDWIYFLGGDDAFYRPDTIESIMTNGNISDDTALVVGNVLYPDGRLFRSRFDKKLYYKNSVHHQSAFYRKRVFDQFRYGLCESSGRRRHFEISGDYQLHLRLFTQGAKSLSVNDIIARCGRGVSMEGRFAGYREEIAIRHQYLILLLALPFDILTLLRYGWKKMRLPSSFCKELPGHRS